MGEIEGQPLHDKALEEITGSGAKVDYMFTVIRTALRDNDRASAKMFLDRAEKEVSKGGDWERKNKLAIYKGVLSLIERRLGIAADVFVGSLATFTPCELISFRDFVFYAVITSIISSDRNTLKVKILESPEILAVVGEVAFLKDLVVSLYGCRYGDFFRNLIPVIDHIRADPYLGKHLGYITRAMRVVCYRQFLLPYRTVTIDMMAAEFNVTSEFIETELSGFISAGKLTCKIDKISRVIESNCLEDSRNLLYSRVIKQGDFLLSKLQKLSRVIDV